jgi:alcohol dehydrogenase class IV
VVAFNSAGSERANKIYTGMAQKIGQSSIENVIGLLGSHMKIPKTLSELIHDEAAFDMQIELMAKLAIDDGCTKTNPVIPTLEEMRILLRKAYKGKE